MLAYNSGWAANFQNLTAGSELVSFRPRCIAALDDQFLVGLQGRVARFGCRPSRGAALDLHLRGAGLDAEGGLDRGGGALFGSGGGGVELQEKERQPIRPGCMETSCA